VVFFYAMWGSSLRTHSTGPAYAYCFVHARTILEVSIDCNRFKSTSHRRAHYPGSVPRGGVQSIVERGRERERERDVPGPKLNQIYLLARTL